MKGWLFTAAMLLMAGTAAATIELPASSSPAAPVIGWCRTTQGWEHVSAWRRESPGAVTQLSPLVVGALQVLISIGALVRWNLATQS